jgi:hypothetical protein
VNLGGKISKIFILEPFFECEKGWNFSNIEIKGIPGLNSRQKEGVLV